MTGARRRTRNAHELAEHEERKIEALRMFMTGASYEKIGQAMGTHRSTAYRRVQSALDDMRPHADYDRYRSVQLAELEMTRRVLRQVIVGWKPGDKLDDAASAMDRLFKLQEREAKLLGLDRVPTPFDDVAAMSDEQLAAEIAKWADEMQAST